MHIFKTYYAYQNTLLSTRHNFGFLQYGYDYLSAQIDGTTKRFNDNSKLIIVEGPPGNNLVVRLISFIERDCTYCRKQLYELKIILLVAAYFNFHLNLIIMLRSEQRKADQGVGGRARHALHPRGQHGRLVHQLLRLRSS